MLEDVAQAFEVRKKVGVLEFGFQTLEIAEVRMTVKLLRALHGHIEKFEGIHAVVERAQCLLLQFFENAPLDKVKEAALVEILPLETTELDEVIEVGGELHFVVPVLSGHLQFPCAVDVESVEAAGQLLFIQYGIEEAELPSSSLLPKGR